MKTATKLAVLAVMLTTLIAGTQVASADDHGSEDHEARKQIHEQVKAAFESGDYNALTEALEGTKKEGTISENDFEILIEARQLKEAGDTEAAKALLEENGVERPFKKHKRVEHRQGFKDALEQNDYQAFIDNAREDGPAANVSEDQFNVMVEAFALRQAGDHEAAKELLQENGIERPNRGKHRSQN